MTVVFSSPVTGDLQKNMPYIIKTTGNVTEFALKTTVSPAEAVAVIRDGGSQEIGRFIGTYVAETTIPDGCLFISGNKFYCSKGLSTSKAFRAYFDLSPAAAGVRAFNLNFGEDDATGIVSTTNLTNYTNSAGAGWYDLSGRKLSGKPTKKGLYINNGRKVVIK